MIDCFQCIFATIVAKTIGIIGFGNNGSSFAKKLRGFDVKILVYDKYLSQISDEYVNQVSLEKLYEEADIISFHIPQNDETIYWADESFFKQIKNLFIF